MFLLSLKREEIELNYVQNSCMKAAVYLNYGPPEVLQNMEISTPAIKQNQVLIRNYATSVNSADWRLRKADPFAVRLVFGLFKPRKKRQVLGAVFSGIVEQVGSAVTRFKVGDRVFGMTGMEMGTYAEYVSVSEKSPIALLPSNLNFKEGASIPFGATTALHFLRKAKVKSGQSVLIYGASGAVGSAAIQLAKYFGAEVTAVCSTSNLDLVKSLGADFQIDYSAKDFTEDNKRYNVIYETVNKLPFSKSIKCLENDGVLILGASGIGQTIRGWINNLIGKQRVISGIAIENQEEINFIKNLIEEGSLKPVIDRTYDLSDIVKAHNYVESQHKKGNVVIEIEQENK